MIKSEKINLKLRPFLKHLKPDLSNIAEVQQDLAAFAEKTAKEIGLENIKNIEKLDLTDPDTGIPGTNIYDLLNNQSFANLTIKQIKDTQGGWLEDNPELLDYLQIFDESTTLFKLIQMRSFKISEELVEKQKNIYENTLNTFLADIKMDPIYDLMNSIQIQVKNPIGELIKTLSERNQDTIPNLDLILDKIQSDYDSLDDITELILNDSQMEDLIKVKDYMKLISGFMYAASTDPNVYNPVGHNKVINEFAKNNKKLLITDWTILPEIDSDYYFLYKTAINKYVTEIDRWIEFSQANNVNKIRKFIAADKAFTSSLTGLIESRNLKLEFDGKEFDLLDGFVNDPSEPEVNLFNAEQTLYDNFQKALSESGANIRDFLTKTNLLTTLIPSLKNVIQQRVAQISDTLQTSELTDYDLLQYFAQVFTLNPSEFYSDLKTRVTQNTDVAPITAQEYAVKLAKAAAKP